jgi:hypothetical protein
VTDAADPGNAGARSAGQEGTGNEEGALPQSGDVGQAVRELADGSGLLDDRADRRAGVGDADSCPLSRCAEAATKALQLGDRVVHFCDPLIETSAEPTTRDLALAASPLSSQCAWGSCSQGSSFPSGRS